MMKKEFVPIEDHGTLRSCASPPMFAESLGRHPAGRTTCGRYGKNEGNVYQSHVFMNVHPNRASERCTVFGAAFRGPVQGMVGQSFISRAEKEATC